MSWSQRFMEKKDGGSAAGAGGGGDWKTVGRVADGGWQRAAGGGGGGGWKPKAEAPKPALNTASEEQFPSLGGAKPRPTAEQARLQGFSALAASWAHQDASEAAEQKRQRDDAMAEAKKREKEAAQYGVLDGIMRRRTTHNSYGNGAYAEETTGANYEGGYSQHGANYEGGYSQHGANHESGYSPHSPTYPPYDEESEPYYEEEKPRSNPMFAYNADEEGWSTH